MNRISAVIITLNEERKIERALKSLQGLADEIVVIDSGSRDATEQICRRYTDRVLFREWTGYRDQKQFATDQARYPWVLSLDADEALSPELRSELIDWKAGSPGHQGYYLPRITFFLGRWIRHTTWYPDWQLRLFEKSRGRWEGGRIHESVTLQGSTGRFSGKLQHYTYSSIDEYLEQLQTFTGLAAADYYDAGKRSSPWRMIFLPLTSFFDNYLLRRGFLDGTAGLVVSCLSATSVFFKYLKLWERQNSLSGRESRPDL